MAEMEEHCQCLQLMLLNSCHLLEEGLERVAYAIISSISIILLASDFLRKVRVELPHHLHRSTLAKQLIHSDRSKYQSIIHYFVIS
jgi:hypothetical protein